MNLAVKFGLELCALAALGYWGASTNAGVYSVLLAVGVPTAAAIVWGLFAAPRATRRLDPTFRIPLELSVFGLACFGLATAGKPTAAWTLGVIITVNAVLLTMFHQWVE